MSETFEANGPIPPPVQIPNGNVPPNATDFGGSRREPNALASGASQNNVVSCTPVASAIVSQIATAGVKVDDIDVTPPPLPNHADVARSTRAPTDQRHEALNPRSIVASNKNLHEADSTRQSLLQSKLPSRMPRPPRPQDDFTLENHDIDIHGAEQTDSSVVIPMRRWKVYRDSVVTWLHQWALKNQPSWLVSLVFHAALMIILAFIAIPRFRPDSITLEIGVAARPDVQFDSYEIELPANDVSDNEELEELAVSASAVETSLDDFAPQELAMAFEPTKISLASIATTNLNATPHIGNIGSPGGVTGRSHRRAGALQAGASAESEEAVDRALVWLAAHQSPDGSWRFDIHRGSCNGKCRHSGRGSRAINGATALALLPFLGAGQTHETGYHRNTVRKGIQFLIKNQRQDGGFNEPQGSMYSHGLASLVLCEALAMSNEGMSSSTKGNLNRKIKKAAQRSIAFIVDAQHSGGGWRYSPGQPGDTSVVGWKAMALQSAKMAGLSVPKKTLAGVSTFLDSVASDSYGATYGYTRPERRAATSAIGLLCRMYLGWNRNHAAIVSGAEYLDDIGPSSNNMYYNYYATQVMHHFQGPLWESWNETLRDHLVESQELKGHERGSWHFEGDHGSSIGGRLYITAMTAMTLEVYYRHMPIYGNEAVPQSKRLGEGSSTE